MQMNAMKIFKILGVIILAGGLVAAGYFWGQDKVHQQMGQTSMGSGEMASMLGMAGMNMAPGTAMVSPQMQQLMGVRTPIVQAKTPKKTVRAVGPRPSH